MESSLYREEYYVIIERDTHQVTGPGHPSM